MNVFRILIFILLFSGSSTAHQGNILNDIYNLPNDTNKVIALLNLCTKYYDISHETSLILAKKSLSLSKEIQYKRGEVESLFRIGNDFFFLNNQKKAILYFEKAIIKAEIINAQYWIARSYRQIASVKIANEDYNDAIILNRKA